MAENNSPRIRDVFEMKLSVKAALGILGSAIAAAFFVGQYIASDRADALQVALDSRAPTSSLPDQLDNSSDTATLTRRIADLESEKNKLSTELAKISLDALNPQSELGNLIKQLQHNEESKREASARGLLELNDPRAAAPLVTYFKEQPEEAREIYASQATLRAVWKMDVNSGSELSLKLLASEDDFLSSQAFDFLRDRAWSKSDEFDQIIPDLRATSLTSTDTLTRTRAKLLLRERETALRKRSELPATTE